MRTHPKADSGWVFAVFLLFAPWSSCSAVSDCLSFFSLMFLFPWCFSCRGFPWSFGVFSAYFPRFLGVRQVRKILDVFEVFLGIFEKTKEKKDRAVDKNTSVCPLSGRKKAHKHKLFALVSVQMALGQTAGCPRVNRAKKFMCSDRNTGNINFSLWLTGGLSQGCPDFQKVYVFTVYVPFSCPTLEWAPLSWSAWFWRLLQSWKPPVSPYPLNFGGAISPPKLWGRSVRNALFYNVFCWPPPKFWGWNCHLLNLGGMGWQGPTMIRVTLLCGRALSGRALWRLLTLESARTATCLTLVVPSTGWMLKFSAMPPRPCNDTPSTIGCVIARPYLALPWQPTPP